MTGRLEAPWTHEQVDNLNTNQRRHPPLWHEFTCSDPHPGFDRTLVATVNGWICPHCDYQQGWCHPFMVKSYPGGLREYILGR